LPVVYLFLQKNIETIRAHPYELHANSGPTHCSILSSPSNKNSRVTDAFRYYFCPVAYSQILIPKQSFGGREKEIQ
jgi:hypothetical protein